MTQRDKLHDDLVRSTQLLVVEGAKIVSAYASRHRLHPTDVEALTRIKVAEEHGAAMTAGSLATELALTSGAVTALIDRLERAGHVRRTRCATDRRKVLLGYSETGRSLAEDFFAPLLRRSVAVMDQFSAEELEVVGRFLDLTAADMAEHRASLTRASPHEAAQE